LRWPLPLSFSSPSTAGAFQLCAKASTQAPTHPSCQPSALQASLVSALSLPLSLAVATNILAALTGSASGGLTIALDALGATYMRIAGEAGIDPAVMHRVAVIGAGALDSLPHNGAVVTLLAVCGSTHRESYFDIVMVAIVGALLALVAVVLLGSAVGSF